MGWAVGRGVGVRGGGGCFGGAGRLPFELWVPLLGLVAVCGMTRGSWFSFVAPCFALGAGDLGRSEGRKAPGAA